MQPKPSAPTKSNIWGKLAAIGTVVLVAATIVTQWESLAGFARNWDDFSDGSVEAKQLRNIPDMLDYLVLHRDAVSLVVFDVGDEEHGLFLNPDTTRPVGPTAELQLVLAYSARVASAELDPGSRVAVADWERYWMPRTDGGSHEYAMRALAARDAVTDGAVQLRDLVRAMVRYSDGSAADFLMHELGRPRVDGLPAQLQMPAQEPVRPLVGQLLSWQSSQLSEPIGSLSERYRKLDRRSYADLAWQLSAALDDPTRFARERERWQDDGLTLSLREQAQMAAVTTPRGQARAYARLMARVASDALPGSADAREILGWIHENEELGARFESVATQAGSQPGMLSSAYYGRAKGHEKVRVLAMFMDQLPMAVWLHLMQKFVHQKFEIQLLTDDEFLEHVKQRLAQ